MKKISLLLVLTMLLSCVSGAFNVYAAGDYDIYVEFDQAIAATAKLNHANYGVNVGQSVTFEIDVPEDGRYGFYLNTACHDSVRISYKFGSDAAVTTAFDDELVTYSWTVYTTLFIDNVNLKKGKTNLVITCTNGGFNLAGVRIKTAAIDDSVDFSKKEGMYRTAVLPTAVQAEDFDLGTYYSTDTKNAGRKYRKEEGIDIYQDGDKTYIKLLAEEYVYYTFNVEYAGAFDMYAEIMENGGAKLWFDDYEIPLEVNFKTDDQAPFASVYLEAGEHKIKLMTTTGELALDAIRFEVAKGEYTTIDELVNRKEEVKLPNPVWKELYVDLNGSDENSGEEAVPFKTMERALDEVKEIAPEMMGDIIVNLLPGYHKLDEKLIMDISHSGQNGFDVVIRGSKTAESVIGGGTRITGWEPTENSVIWSAPVDENVEAFRTMFVNDNPAFTAKSKYRYQGIGEYHAEGSEFDGDGAIIDKVNFIDGFAHPEDIELQFPIVWCNHIVPMDDVEFTDEQVIFKGTQPGWGNNWHLFPRATKNSQIIYTGGTQFFITNAPELMDEPGEFYFDNDAHRVYYYPYTQEDMTTAEVYAGTTEGLMKITGESREMRAHNIRFENVAFKHGSWNEITEHGMRINQADTFLSKGYNGDSLAQIASQVEVEYADNIGFEGCVFKGLGSTGLCFINAVSDSEIIGNIFKDISGSAVCLGRMEIRDWTETEDLEILRRIKVNNNVFRSVATEFMGSIGIMIYFVDDLEVKYNDIQHTAYSGISSCWGWGQIVVDNQNQFISNNKIMDTLEVLHDGAAIYTMGPIKGGKVTNNYVNRTYHGLYYDAGSMFTKASDNVFLNVREDWLCSPSSNVVDLGCSNSYTNTKNTSVGNPGQLKQQNNTFVDENNLPEGALKIIAEAGLEDEYKYLLDKADKPEWRQLYVDYVPKAVFNGDDQNIYVDGLTFTGGPEVGYHREVSEPANRLNVFYDGEWVNYPITIPEDGEYDISMMMRSGYMDATFLPYATCYIDGELVNEKAEVKKVSWQSFIAEPVARKYLTKGDHVLRLEWHQDTGGHVQLHRLKIRPVGKLENDPRYKEGVFEELIPKKEFYDIKGHWAEATINKLTEMEIIKGVSDTTFLPGGTLTKEQAALLVLRANKQKDDKVYTLINENEKNDYITREEFAVMIMSYYPEYSISYSENVFKDQYMISAEALIKVLGAKDKGFMKGDNNGNFNAKSSLTRAEAATVIERVAGY